MESWEKKFLTQSSSDQGYLIIKGIWMVSKANYAFVNVYAPNDPNRRRALWWKLEREINSDCDTRWIIFGDSNAVRSPFERLGSRFCQSTADHFNNFISKSGLIDIQLGSRRFTYMSMDGSKHSKLDCFTVNLTTINDWSQLKAVALPRLHSDHCPILLTSGVSDFGSSPFRFFNSWLLDDSLEDIVRAGWTTD